MDQDTFSIARMSAELAQLHRDLADLAQAVQRISRHLELHDTSWENRSEWTAWAASLGEIRQRHSPAGGVAGLPVFLWTRWTFDQEPVASGADGFACYAAWLTWDAAATPVMAFASGETYATGRQATGSDSPDATTYWTGVPGHRRPS